MKIFTRLTALSGLAGLTLLMGGCADVGPDYGPGVGYASYGAYDGPYYGGYGPYYGDTVLVGGYNHRGYYGAHHVYGGGFHGGGRGRFGGGGIETGGRGGGFGGGGHGGGFGGGGHGGGGGHR